MRPTVTALCHQLDHLSRRRQHWCRTERSWCAAIHHRQKVEVCRRMLFQARAAEWLTGGAK